MSGDRSHLGNFLCAASDVIPLKFQRASGVLSHTFRLATDRYFGSVDQLEAFPILIQYDGTWSKYLVPMAQFPSEVEALAILAEIDGETERQGRYINIHSAYEAVVRPRDVMLSAIRHALAHPITALTRQDVHAALLSQFGGLRIDLTKHDHQRIIYLSIGAMLIAIDVAIHRTFSTRIRELVPADGTKHDGGIKDRSGTDVTTEDVIQIDAECRGRGIASTGTTHQS